MSDVVIFDRMQQRRGTAANLAAVNEVLRAGEVCWESDTGKFKIGDGSTAWASLPYQGIWTLADIRAALDLLGSTATGDIIYKGASGWARLAVGTDGHVLTAASGLPSWAVSGGGGGGSVTYIGTTTVAGSAVSSIAISSLDLDAHGSYIADVYLTNATASSSTISLYYNADNTATNYDRQGFGFNGALTTGGRANDAIVNVLNPSTRSQFRLHILVHSGVVFASAIGQDKTATSLEQRWFEHNWRTVGTNVTAITLAASVASSIGVGSRVKLWRLT